MIVLKFIGQDAYTCLFLFLSTWLMGKKKQKLVRHTAEQLVDAPSAHLHMASIYTFQSGKPLVRTESLMDTQLLPPTVQHDEDPPLANTYHVWDAGDFVEDMPFPDGYVCSETSKRKRTAAVSVFGVPG